MSRADSNAPEAAKAQQDPQSPWSGTGLTLPRDTQEKLDEAGHVFPPAAARARAVFARCAVAACCAVICAATSGGRIRPVMLAKFFPSTLVTSGVEVQASRWALALSAVRVAEAKRNGSPGFGSALVLAATPDATRLTGLAGAPVGGVTTGQRTVLLLSGALHFQIPLLFVRDMPGGQIVSRLQDPWTGPPF